MEEVMKLLGPWPILQFMFGLVVLGGGVWAIIKGTGKGNSAPRIEDKTTREQWSAYEHIRNIEENSYKSVAHLERIHEELQRISTILWNQGGGRWRDPG